MPRFPPRTYISSVLSRGLTMLNNSIITVVGGPGSTKSVSFLGYSHSAVPSSMEIPKLLAEVPTPFGFLPPWETTGAILGPALIHGAQQGLSTFAADIAAKIPTGPPTLPTLAVFTGGRPARPRCFRP